MANLTLLGIVAAFTTERALPVPSIAAGNTDKQVAQIVGLLNAFCRDMTTRKAFQQNSVECTLTTVAAEDQGDIDTIAPYGFEGILLETMFNRTLRLPMAGGVQASEWQARQALNFTGPLYRFRLRGNRFLMNPVPTAGQTIAFEYFSSFFVRTAAGVPKAAWTVDSDYCTLGSDLPLAYLTWAWAKSKGFEYAEDFVAYERLVTSKLGRSNAPQVVNLGETQNAMRPGVVVSPGSWPL